MPVLPGITDSTAALDALVQGIAKSNASYVGACALRLRRTARERYLQVIDADFPALAEKYRRAYAHGHQVGDAYREALSARMSAICARHGVKYGRYYETESGDDDIATEGLLRVAEQQLAFEI